MKGLILILDGLGDRPIAGLDGRTPLAAAHTPNLDALAASGTCALLDPMIPDVPADTHNGAGALMGVPAGALQSLARGPIEAAGIGMELSPGDIALRGNFATLARNGAGFAIRDRRAGRIDRVTRDLAAALTDVPLGDGVTGTLRPGTQHRAVVRLSGADLSPRISDTDPGAAGGDAALPCVALEPGDAAAERTAEALNRFVAHAFDVLSTHPINLERQARGALPANGILTRNPGRYEDTPSLVRTHGVRAAIVAAEHTMLGLGRTLGYDLVTDPRFTALPDTDLDAKVGAARAALRDHELVALHVKGTDICAHDQDPGGKRAMLERIDAALAPLLEDDIVIAVSCDHATDSNTGAHTGDAVPALLRTPGRPGDSCTVFTEEACAAGSLGRIPATGFFVLLLRDLGVAV